MCVAQTENGRLKKTIPTKTLIALLTMLMSDFYIQIIQTLSYKKQQILCLTKPDSTNAVITQIFATQPIKINKAAYLLINSLNLTIKDMRIINEFLKEEIKITLYHWNNRYLIKLEWQLFEQTYKVSEWDVTSEAELSEILDEAFMASAKKGFQEMAHTLGTALQRLS